MSLCFVIYFLLIKTSIIYSTFKIVQTRNIRKALIYYTTVIYTGISTVPLLLKNVKSKKIIIKLCKFLAFFIS